MPKETIKKFVYKLIAFTIVMTILSVLFQIIFQKYSSPALPYIVIFFFIVTFFTLYIPLRDPDKKQGAKFVSNYLLARIIKFLSCIIFFLIYLILNKYDKISFTISFITIYFVYSFFEILILKKEK